MNAEEMSVLAGAALAMVDPTVTHGHLTVDVAPGAWVSALTWARDELGCTFFDLRCAVDELDSDPAGIAVVAHLLRPHGRHHLLMRTLVSAVDPRLPTATGVFRGADRHERETRETLGLMFTGHPDLDPSRLPDGLEGTPLRQEFVLASRVVQPSPGAVNAGRSAGEAARRPGRRPPGMPDPERRGPPA